MSAAAGATILVITCGSARVKLALFAAAEPPLRLWSGAVERIGPANSRFHAVDAKCAKMINESGDIADHPKAARLSRTGFAVGGRLPQNAAHLRPIHRALPYCIHGSSHEHA